MKPDNKPTAVVVASHPRSGTHLLLDLLRRQFASLDRPKWPGQSLETLYLNVDLISGPDRYLSTEAAQKLWQKSPTPLIKTHHFASLEEGYFPNQGNPLLPAWQDRVGQAHKLYILRDPRAVLASLWQFTQGFDPDCPASLSAFIRSEIGGENRAERWARHVLSWHQQADVRCLRFEDLVAQPDTQLQDIADFLQLPSRNRQPILPAALRSVWHRRWVQLTQRRPQGSNLGARGGPKLDWRKAYSPDDLAFLRQEAGAALSLAHYSF